MKTFNNKQLEAINTLSHHTAVLAGAGTGKTTVLIERIKTILEFNNDKSNILVLTFTKKAALEMKERLNIPNINVSTFDSFCYNLIKSKKIEIIEDDTTFTKSELLSFNLYDCNLKTGYKPKKYDEYVNYKQKENLVDFNDIEYEALNYIKKNNIKFEHILIDEFQDTNYLQYEIFKNLIKKTTKTFIVGDPDQSIYGFRGAKKEIFENYLNHFKANKIILNINYRSNTSIVKLANDLISNNKNRIKKTLIANNSKNTEIFHLCFDNEKIEYNYITKMFDELKNKYKSFAVIFRNHTQGYFYKKFFSDNYKDVNVISIHESKGLEFDVVFIIGINSDTIPSNHHLSLNSTEEERRLFFVGITRAKHLLYICSNKKYSKFIKELKIKKRMIER